MAQQEKIRLQKIIADCGLASRRKAEEWIAAGDVRVNGETAALGDKADPRRDKITVRGRPLHAAGENRYLLLHKPRGYITTMSDERGRKCVADLVEDVEERVYPVGRLDKDTVGLLLLTDDGPLAHELLSPKKHVDKVYYARVEGRLEGADCEALASGMVLGDGSQCLPALLEPLGRGDECRLTLREGKYHQVKRMLAARGKPVVFLRRLSMGPLSLGEELKEGEWRLLTEEEAAALQRIRSGS